ncbi:hypothetical protein N9N18_03270 [Euryarchaeota archaeon]|nr:hypothetical protein [Euryarchaeota archaeon]
MENSIVTELTHMLEGDFLGQHNLKLRRKYERGGKGWKRNTSATESLFKAAIIQGIDKCPPEHNQPVQEIWCSDVKKEHDALERIGKINNEYNPDFQSIRLSKYPDLAWRTGEGALPNWFCQIKVLTTGQGTNYKKSVQALGDLFWGAVDRHYLRHFHKHDAEFIFVWIEDKNAVHSTKLVRKNDVAQYLNFNENDGVMKFILSPGYHKDLLSGNSNDGFGELRFEGQGDEVPWINKAKAIVKPHGRTAIKEILAAGTNGTFFRMFNQPGKLIISTDYRQFDTGNWHIYIHRLRPSIRVIKSDVNDSKFGGGKLFNWIP